jgi:hypothetical protein
MNTENKNLNEILLNSPKIYFFLDARTGEFGESISESEFNKLQLLQNSMWGKTIEYYLDNYVFGGDGRYTIDYFTKKIEEFKINIKE